METAYSELSTQYTIKDLTAECTRRSDFMSCVDLNSEIFTCVLTVNAVYRLIYYGRKRHSYLLFNVEGQMQVKNLVESKEFFAVPPVTDFYLL